MGKYQNEKANKRGALLAVIAVLLVVVLAGFGLFVMPRLSEGDNPQSNATEEVAPTDTEAATENQSPTEVSTTEPAPASILPVALEDGQLEIQSLFQFDGINPDCENQEGTGIAAMVLKNTSGIYLAEAAVTLTLADGTELNFEVTDLPADGSVMAFSVDNRTVPADAVCVDATCTAAFDEDAGMAADQVSVTTDGWMVTVNNISGADIPELVIYCRSPFGEEYFGGVTYKYTIYDLPAGGTATVEAWDCILGFVEVVRVEIL